MKAKWEVKKILNIKGLTLFILAFMIFNCINIYRSYDPSYLNKSNDDLLDAEIRMGELLEGKITQDKVNNFNSKYNEVIELYESNQLNSTPDYSRFYTGYVFGDYNLFTKINNELKRRLTYNQQISALKNEAEEKAKIYETSSRYNYMLNKTIVDSYGTRYIDSYYYNEPAINLFTYNFSSILIILLIMFFCIPLFTNERDSDMLTILACTKRGYLKRGIRADKIITMVMFVAFITILFTLSDFVMLKSALKFNGLTQPLFVLEKFKYTPTTMSIIAFYILCTFMKFIGFTSIGFITMIIARLSKSSVLGYIITLISILLLMTLKSMDSNTVVQYINLINPVSLFLLYKNFYNCELINVFSMPVFNFVMYIALGALTSIVLCIINLLVPFFYSHKAKRNVL